MKNALLCNSNTKCLIHNNLKHSFAFIGALAAASYINKSKNAKWDFYCATFNTRIFFGCGQ